MEQMKIFPEVLLKKNSTDSIWQPSYGWLNDFTNKTKKFYSPKKSIRTLSLFSGAGGLDIGFHDAGFEIVSSVEIEKVFSETLRQNSGEGRYFETTEVNCIDIREFDFDEKVDFIIGGPPCQTFSAAGRRASGVAGTTDARGVLFLEYVRLLEKLQPKGFLFENVYGILGAQNGEAWQQIREAFSNVGYKLHYRILDAADYGVPQHRERLIIIGLKEGEYLFPRPTHGPDSIDNVPHYSAEESLKEVKFKQELKVSLGGEHGPLLKDIPPGLNYSFYTEKMGHPNPIFGWRSKFSDFLYKADNEKPVRTIKAQGGQYTGPFHWDARAFDTNELKRLQTFPDNYEIYGGRGKIIHQIGNSVPPQLARLLACSIQKQIFNNGTPVELEYLSPTEELTFRKRKRQLTKIYAEKAKNAIEHLYSVNNQEVKEISSISTEFTFSDKLTIEYAEDSHFSGELAFTPEKTIIRVLNKNAGDAKNIIYFSPVDKWSLSTDMIELHWNGDCLRNYIVVWKFFEDQLRRQGLKSDLVQLAGYYQYMPSVKIEWCPNTLSNSKTYQLISKLTSLEFTRRNMLIDTIDDLISSFNLDTMSTLREYKKLGLDVRNSNTNPMLKEQEILIPYEFPTLYGRSVQYSKEL
ncbi:DNA cytosine methyltransferase [Colwellia sp. 75C3]|uniref:DNA cytosine methyltransferase n=1 Tax=Colwellia sp. 75C3 TaxID=888425 RepID=UPI0018E39797|nr:DNA cytosine methyltransferase [Colwellia sp. 75C3]